MLWKKDQMSMGLIYLDHRKATASSSWTCLRLYRSRLGRLCTEYAGGNSRTNEAQDSDSAYWTCFQDSLCRSSPSDEALALSKSSQNVVERCVLKRSLVVRLHSTGVFGGTAALRHVVDRALHRADIKPRNVFVILEMYFLSLCRQFGRYVSQ